jgi:hypothetical protein
MRNIFLTLVLTIMKFECDQNLKPSISKVTPIDEGRYYFQNSLLIPKNKKMKVTWTTLLKKSSQV